MKLPEALHQALMARFRVPEVKTPATQRRGLMARISQIAKAIRSRGDTPAQVDRKVAKELGVTPRTLKRWRDGKASPSPKSVRRVETAHNRLVVLPAYRRALKARGVPGQVKVTGVIKWSKSSGTQYNSTPYRTTTLAGVRGVMVRVIRAWAAAGPEAAAQVFEHGISAVYGVPPDGDAPGIEIQGDQVIVHLP